MNYKFRKYISIFILGIILMVNKIHGVMAMEGEKGEKNLLKKGRLLPPAIRGEVFNKDIDNSTSSLGQMVIPENGVQESSNIFRGNFQSTQSPHLGSQNDSQLYSPSPSRLCYFDTKVSSHRLAYKFIPPRIGCPLFIFLNDFHSDMTGRKVRYLENLCLNQGRGFLAFDHFGHGLSSGKFEDGTVSQWLSDSIEMINFFTKEPAILIGSSMGVWLAHLIALHNPSHVKAIIGIASAPDFTEELLWKKFTMEQKSEIGLQGWTKMPTKYDAQGWWPISRDLIEDGRKHIILDKPINLSIPIRLIHGMEDQDVPYLYSERLLKSLVSSDVALTLIKAGDHRLSRDEDLNILSQIVNGVSSSAEPVISIVKNK